MFLGDGKDYLNLALKDGIILLTMNLGGGMMEKSIQPPGVRFDDNHWHKVTVHRKVHEVRNITKNFHFREIINELWAGHHQCSKRRKLEHT